MKGRGSAPENLWRRRCRWALMAAGCILALGVLWLLGHLVPRTGYFAMRRSAIVEAAVEPAVQTSGGYLSQLGRIRAGNGLTVTFRVLRPAEPVRRLPVVMLLGGLETGRDAVEVVGDPGPIAVVALDYPYHGPKRFRSVLPALGHVPAMQRALLDTPPAISLVLDWVVRQPWANASQVEVMGVSFGVPFAAAAGALDSRLRRVWLVHGGADNRAWLANRLESRLPSAPIRIVTATLLHLLAHGASFDTARWAAQISPRPVVIIGAAEDEEMPRASVERLFESARNPKELLWSKGGHVRPDRVDIVRQLLDFARQRIAQESGDENQPK